MPVFRLSRDIDFPPVHLAEHEGLLAVGGDLRVARLLTAYRNGIFPWYSDPEPILGWSPDPRFVLFPRKLKISHSMKQLLNRDRFRVTFDRDFKAIIGSCRKMKRKGQNGTWITSDMMKAYCRLHEEGHAHSVEVWEGGKLAGGLYGVAVGSCFCGESMFAAVPNASKFALVHLVNRLVERGFDLIDCQVPTDHLRSLGAEEMPRERFIVMLRKCAAKHVSWG